MEKTIYISRQIAEEMVAALRINYFGILAAVLAFASLGFPWFFVTATSYDQSIHMSYTAYLYQIQGSVNGIPATAFPNIWFVMSALVLIIVTAVCCLAGSFQVGRRGQLLLLAAGIVALLSIVVFGAGLLNSDYANSSLEPGAIMNLFPSGTFGQTTVDVAMQNGYNFSWYLSIGFWLAIGVAIMAFVGTVAPSLKNHLSHFN